MSLYYVKLNSTFLDCGLNGKSTSSAILAGPFPDLLPQFLLDDIARVARDELMHCWSIRSEDAQLDWIDSR